jgi:2-methylcitrate dehydratase PrpD
MGQAGSDVGPSPGAAGPTAARRLAEFISTLEYDAIPGSVVRAAKLHALDTIGVGIAAAVLPGEASTARTSIAVFVGMGGRAEASMIGVPERVPAANAAFANGSLQHALDFDDIHTDSRVHSSTMVVPASLAVAERGDADGRAFVTAMVAGHETATRIGMGGPIHFQKHGFHGTPVAGVFGVVASSAVLLGLDAETTAHALGIAGDTAGGTNAWIAEGTPNKHFHAGWASHSGVISADLAVRGALGPPGVFEGRYGIYEALTGRPDVDMEPVLGTLGSVWETPRCAFKAYPACYWSHGSIDAALAIRAEIAGELEEIDSIEAIVPTPAVTIVLEPRETRINPLSPYSGKFSLQYSVASMLLRGTVDLDTYTATAMADERVRELTARVGYVVSPAFDEGEQLYPGGLRVRMRDGREYVVEVPEPRGTELNPISEGDLLTKFRSCAGHGLTASDTDVLADAILNVEERGAVAQIGSLLRLVRPD